MSLDFRREQAIPLADVPRYVPKRRGKKVHYSTVYRWATKGARGRKLETILSGGLRYTTIEAVQRFLDATPSVATRMTDDLNDVIDAVDKKMTVSM